MKQSQKIKDFKKLKVKELDKKQMQQVQGGNATGYDIVIVWSLSGS